MIVAGSGFGSEHEQDYLAGGTAGVQPAAGAVSKGEQQQQQQQLEQQQHSSSSNGGSLSNHSNNKWCEDSQQNTRTSSEASCADGQDLRICIFCS